MSVEGDPRSEVSTSQIATQTLARSDNWWMGFRPTAEIMIGSNLRLSLQERGSRPEQVKIGDRTYVRAAPCKFLVVEGRYVTDLSSDENAIRYKLSEVQQVSAATLVEGLFNSIHDIYEGTAQILKRLRPSGNRLDIINNRVYRNGKQINNEMLRPGASVVNGAISYENSDTIPTNLRAEEPATESTQDRMNDYVDSAPAAEGSLWGILTRDDGLPASSVLIYDLAQEKPEVEKISKFSSKVVFKGQGSVTLSYTETDHGEMFSLAPQLKGGLFLSHKILGVNALMVFSP